MKKPAMYVVSQPDYFDPWRDLFRLVFRPADADVILFSGGADVWPGLYGEGLGWYTYSDPKRDLWEKHIFEAFPKKQRLGICRGAQFLCVMAGGKLVQHVRNHGRWHDVETKSGPVFMSSTHHQMMRPGKVPHELLGWCKNRSSVYLDGDNKEISEMNRSGVEPEMVFFPRTTSLCIQGHPEIMDAHSGGVKFCQQLVKKYLL